MGCEKMDKEMDITEETNMENVRTDLDQITKWFPNLEDIQAAQWEIIMDDEGDYKDLPAPGSYAASGYIFINKNTAEKYLTEYEWQKTEPNVEFRYVSSDILDTGGWMYSRQFDKDMRPLKFIGKLWFNGEVVLFTGGR